MAAPSEQRQRRSTNSKMTTWSFRLVFLIVLFLLVLVSTIRLPYDLLDQNLNQSSPVRRALAGYAEKRSTSSFRSELESEDSLQFSEELIDEYYPVEEPLPNPAVPADGYSTFSACLLVMDDNHRLPEWLAYHYHVLPLRYLVVTMDPRSVTSPSSIWNRWRKRGVTIIEWTDYDFWHKKLKPLPENATLEVTRDRHRGRQKFFYKKCLEYLKTQNRTWVSLHDTDEYLVYNHAGGERYEEFEGKMALRTAHSKAKNRQPRIVPSKLPTPSLEESGKMIEYIRQEYHAGVPYYQSPCIGIPRLQFSATELSEPLRPDVQRTLNKLDSFNYKHLDTLRFHHHANRNDKLRNAWNKVLIDVSRINIVAMPQFRSLHRPIKKYCPEPWLSDWESGLRINHYLGSWNSYSVRTNDARRGLERSYEQWEYKSAHTAATTDDNIIEWINGYVNEVGVDEAEALLQHSGETPKRQEDNTWHLLPHHLENILAGGSGRMGDKKRVAFDKYVRAKYQEQEDRE